MFWQLLPALVIGSQVRKSPLLSAEKNRCNKKRVFDEKTRRARPQQAQNGAAAQEGEIKYIEIVLDVPC